MQIQNRAAWLVSKETSPLEVRASPLPVPGDHEIVIRTHAVAINPVDQMVQLKELWPMQYPATLGCDCAGEIIQIGAQVTRFKPGDRVVGIAGGQTELFTGRANEKTVSRAAFQEYVLLSDRVVCGIPRRVSYEEAVVLPLGFNTAAAGLFSPDELSLPLPSTGHRSSGQAILIWGAATSVGLNAVQLATASGLQVIATASPHNHALVRQLGATEVFDYHDADIEQILIGRLKGKTCAGALDASGKAAESCSAIVASSTGRKYVACAQPPPESGYHACVECKFIIAPSVETLDFGRSLWHEFLPHALESGAYVPVPAPRVIGKGLENVQSAFAAYRQGDVSATKLVVSV